MTILPKDSLHTPQVMSAQYKNTMNPFHMGAVLFNETMEPFDSLPIPMPPGAYGNFWDP